MPGYDTGRSVISYHMDNSAIDGEARADRFDLASHLGFDGGSVFPLGHDVEDVADPAGKLLALVFTKATGGYGWSTKTQTGGDKGALRVAGHSVLVDGDMSTAQSGVCVLAGQSLLDQREQEEV